MAVSTQALTRALESGDDASLRAAFGDYFRGAQTASPGQRDEMLAALDPVLRAHAAEDVGSIAILAGALVEVGGSPLAFPSAVFDHLLAFLRAIPDDREFELPEAFYELERGAMACLSRSAELRRTLPHKPAMLAAIRRYDERYGFLGKMLRVLDDEPLVVLHPATERGFVVRIAGIADNFQLHLLLHAALAGPDRIPGERPTAAAIAASSDGEVGRDRPQVSSRWQLADWTGLRSDGTVETRDQKRGWIWNEGMPAEIALFEDRRIVLIGESQWVRGWPAGRCFSGMIGRAVLEETLPGDDVRALLDRIVRAVSLQ